jgi:glycerate dehydrogenase
MSTQPLKTVFLDYDTVSNGDLDLGRLREAAGDLILYDSSETTIAERIKDADVALVNKLDLTRELLSGAPRLKLVALAATGTNNVDLSAARELRIAVCNVRAYCTASVVQHVWGLILSLTQHVSEFSRLAKDGSWARDEAGAVLAKIAGRPASPPQSGRVPLDQLLATADIVSLHCPLNDATRGLIGARELALMKPDALLINTARGALIDGAALAAALKAGRLGGAGIDVLRQEPPADAEPLLDCQIPNLLVTPHIAWAAREARQRCIDEMAANIRDFQSGGRRGRVV